MKDNNIGCIYSNLKTQGSLFDNVVFVSVCEVTEAP